MFLFGCYDIMIISYCTKSDNDSSEAGRLICLNSLCILVTPMDEHNAGGPQEGCVDASYVRPLTRATQNLDGETRVLYGSLHELTGLTQQNLFEPIGRRW